MLFNVFISDLEVNVKSLLITFANDTRVGGVVTTVEDRAVSQSDLGS